MYSVLMFDYSRKGTIRTIGRLFRAKTIALYVPSRTQNNRIRFTPANNWNTRIKDKFKALIHRIVGLAKQSCMAT